MNEENGMQQEVPVAQPVDQAWRLYGPAAVIEKVPCGLFREQRLLGEEELFYFHPSPQPLDEEQERQLFEAAFMKKNGLAFNLNRKMTLGGFLQDEYKSIPYRHARSGCIPVVYEYYYDAAFNLVPHASALEAIDAAIAQQKGEK